jgi:hypothetical protein
MTRPHAAIERAGVTLVDNGERHGPSRRRSPRFGRRADLTALLEVGRRHMQASSCPGASTALCTLEPFCVWLRHTRRAALSGVDLPGAVVQNHAVGAAARPWSSLHTSWRRWRRPRSSRSKREPQTPARHCSCRLDRVCGVEFPSSKSADRRKFTIRPRPYALAPLTVPQLPRHVWWRRRRSTSGRC